MLALNLIAVRPHQRDEADPSVVCFIDQLPGEDVGTRETDPAALDLR